MIDWTKPIFAKMTTNLIPAKFIGFRSNGQAIVECFDKIHTEVDPETGQIGFLKFINKPKYKYVPFNSYEEVIPLIGVYVKNKDPQTNHQEYQRFIISGILIGKDKADIIIQYGALPYEYCNFNILFEKYIFENTKEPVGKKVEV